MGKRLGRLLRPGMGMYFLVMGAFCAAALVLGQYWLAAGESVVTLVVFLLYSLGRRSRDRKLRSFLQENSNTLEAMGGGVSPFPAFLVRLGDGGIIWTNHRFAELTGIAESMTEFTLGDLLPGFGVDWLAAGKHEAPGDVTLDGRRYRVYGTTIRAEDNRNTLLGMMYLSDLTELYQVRDEYVRSRPVVCIIMIDNYDELTKNLSESAISNMNAKINDSITAWTEHYHGLLRKLERNRYLFVFEKRDLKEAVEEKFSILEDIHQIVSPGGVPASISIGLGVDGENFEESYNFAALGVEMSLSRGGDQAVVKDRFNFTFYGGKNKETDYRSKVRSRVTANSLMELIGQSSHVFIMGHKNADLDALGAAVGVACLCRKRGKKFSIVLDPEKNSAVKLVEELRTVPEYRDVFLSGQDALMMCDNRSILIVVDTNRPDQVECEPLLEANYKVCVIDHHRRAADFIDPVAVTLLETYASSASELVTEVMSYVVESSDVLPIEAKALLAGICLDTKFFNVRTGERTFDAAAMLRRMGADTTEVKLLLQNDYQGTMEKYEIIKAAQLYREEIAIAALDTTTNRILAAQAADELLNISGITASFVMYPEDDRVIISARSIGSANVQVILEALGGGGNAATAGAQIPGLSVNEALEQLVASIDRFYEE